MDWLIRRSADGSKTIPPLLRPMPLSSSAHATDHKGLSRADCVTLGRRLAENGLISYVSRKRENVFKDDYLLYQFNRAYTSDASAGGAFGEPYVVRLRSSPTHGNRAKTVDIDTAASAAAGGDANASMLARCRGRQRSVCSLCVTVRSVPSRAFGENALFHVFQANDLG